MPLALACADAGHRRDRGDRHRPSWTGSRCRPSPSSPSNSSWTASSPKPRGVIPASTEPSWWSGCSPMSPPRRWPQVLVPKLEELTSRTSIIYEGMNVGAGVAASVLGIPAVPYAIALTQMGFAFIHPGGDATIAAICGPAAASSRPRADPLLGQALLDPTPPSLRRFNGPLDIPQDPHPPRRVRRERGPAAGLAGGAPHPAAGLSHLGYGVVRRGGGVEPGDQRDRRSGRRSAGRGRTGGRSGRCWARSATTSGWSDSSTSRGCCR